MSDNNKNTSLEDLDWGLGKVVWAKTNMKDPNDLRWSSLAQHSIDTALVAGKVWDKFLPDTVKNRISEGFNGDKDVARRTVMFLAGCHDVGKATPAFEKQAYGATGEARLNDLESHGMVIPQDVKPSELRHEISGYWALSDYFQELGLTQAQASRLATPVGGHHGKFHAKEKFYENKRLQLRVCFEGSSDKWQKARKDVIQTVASETLDDTVIETLKEVSIDLDVQSLIAGIITVSDWIASDQYKFELTVNGLSPQNHETRRVKQAWLRLGLPLPHSWSDEDPEDHFPERFDLPSHARPNSMQDSTIKIAKSIKGRGGLLIIEAPMGGGKTEAALMAAEILGRRNDCGGVAFALPTQATANGILPRLAGWAQRTTNTRESLRLMHGKAWLNNDYNDIKNGTMYDEDDHTGIITPRWLDGSKQGLLANYVVCTIDQILMMSLRAKHFDLRHLGLAGKVVIIDEVHAADDYMMVYLQRSLEWLGSYNTPVVILSATLPKDRREELAIAYRRGMARSDVNNQDLKVISGAEEFVEAYPLITKVDSTSAELIPLKVDDTVDEDHNVNIKPGDLTDLKKLLEDGGNALVICNTVSKAQRTFDEIKNDPFFEDWDLIDLIHSRYVATDRRWKEDRLRGIYGKNATIENGGRPTKSVIVSTQVVEQSLDVDFDVLLTDVCPMDLLLQRIGRVHRHSIHDEGRPNELKEVQVLVDGWHFNDKGDIELDKGSRGSGMIYGMSKLLRTIALTGFENGRTVRLPGMIPNLVQRAYATQDGDDPDYSASALKEMFGVDYAPERFGSQLRFADEEEEQLNGEKKERAKGFLLKPPFKGRPRVDVESKYSPLLGSNDVDVENSDEKMHAAVRDSSMGVGCILMMETGVDDYVTFVDALSPEDGAPLSEAYPMVSLDSLGDVNEEQTYSLVRDIVSQGISLPPELSSPWIIDRTIAWMEENCRVPGWQVIPELKGEFVLVLDRDGHKRVNIPDKKGDKYFDLCYSSQYGLICTSVKS